MGDDYGMRAKALAFIRIVRPIPAMAAAATVWIGAGLAGRDQGAHKPEVVLLSLMIFLAVAVANAYNDIRDVSADLFNGRPRPIAQGFLSMTQAWVVLAVCLASSLVLAAAVSRRVFVTDLALVAGSLVYSWRAKGTVLIGNALVAGLGSVPLLLGAKAAGTPVDRIIVGQLLIFTYMFGYEVLKSLRDAGGDTAAGYVTVATRWGERTALAIWLLLVISFIVLTIWCGVSLHPGWSYFALMIILVDGLLAFVSMRVLMQRMSVSRAVSFCTVAWLPGLLAIGRIG
ncbi:UbiA family prenyltransferase [Streptomyces sp. NPDC052727]|uniref:UbiA family prenyltransferase n=1 Tax=Streptomyces sp. NPDC052727 TaxID=3154854 RepID=UPI003447F472